MWRLIGLPIFMIAYFALLWIPLYILGWALIPLAAALGAYHQDPAGLYHFDWPIMAIYDNASDGITCQDKETDGSYVFWPTVTSMYGRIWRWSAMRNPLASITKIPWVHCAIDPNKVQFTGSLGDCNENHSYITKNVRQYNQKVPCWYIAWDGLFSCFYWQFNWNGLSILGWQPFSPGLYLLWVGPKIKPTDVFGVENYRTPRTYNTIQFSFQGPAYIY